MTIPMWDGCRGKWCGRQWGRQWWLCWRDEDVVGAGVTIATTATLIFSDLALYLGLFVDNFIYFSQSTAVEEAFDSQFGDIFKVNFQGPATHFLGLNFYYQKDLDDHVITPIS